MVFLMLLVYLGGFHKPAVHDLDIAIITDDAATSVGLEQNLTGALGDGLHVRSVASEDEAREQLKNREISAAYLPQGDHANLLLASAASSATAETVTKIFQQTAQQQGIPLAIEDAVPTEENDPIGQNSLNTSLSDVVAKILLGKEHPAGCSLFMFISFTLKENLFFQRQTRRACVGNWFLRICSFITITSHLVKDKI